MKLVFVLSTTLIVGMLGIVAPVTLAQSPSSPTPTAPDDASNQAPVEQTGRPYVGIQMVTLTPETAQEINKDPSLGLQVPETEGVVIIAVFPDTPATTADLRQGDFIVEVEGQPISTAEQVRQIVANSQVGQSLSFTIQRGDQTTTVSVRLAEKPAPATEN